MKLPGTLGTLDWGDWALGLWSAIITGGSSAVLSSVGLTMLDPKDFNVSEGKLWYLAGGLFCWNGFLGMLTFLRQKPAPSKLVETTVQTFDQPANPKATTVVTTTKETVLQPLNPPADGTNKSGS